MLRWPFCFLMVMLGACTQLAPPPTEVATQTLLPRETVPPSDTATAGQGVAPLQTQGPSPTPLTHIIVEGDTLISIAIDYGVDLADLLLANPRVNPRLLSVGQALHIPRSGAQGPVPSATPYPTQLSPVSCYPAAPDGLLCMLTATTQTLSALEGIVALVTLVDEMGKPLRTQTAFSPINLLAPESKVPLSARFEPPLPDFESASAVVISALQATGLDSRYADVALQVTETRIASDARSAVVVGSLLFADIDAARASAVRVVVLALSESGQLAGFRTWELPAVGQATDFNLTVSSLGPLIHSIEVLAEAALLP